MNCFEEVLSEVLSDHICFEAIFSRGLRLWINGKRPLEADWSYGGEEYGVTVSTDGGEPLSFEEFKLTEFQFNIPIDEIGTEQPPSTATLFTDKGKISLRVVALRYGDPDDYDEETGRSTLIKMANGQDMELDTMLYIRAES